MSNINSYGNSHFDKAQYIRAKKRYTLGVYGFKICGVLIGLGFVLRSISPIPEGTDQPENYRISMIIIGVLISFVVSQGAEMFGKLLDSGRDGDNVEAAIRAHEDVAGRVYEGVEELRRVINNSLNVERMDTYADSIKILTSRISTARKVRNTFVGVSGETDVGLVAKSYDEFLSKRGNVWHDIVSPAELFSERYYSIDPRDFAIGRHRISVLRHSLPMINFIILDYDNERSSEVYWGWVDSSRGSEGALADVFRTDDRAVVEMFANLFDYLVQSKCDARIQTDFSKSGDNRFRTKSNAQVVNKEGVWYTRAYRQRDKRDRSARSADTSKALSYKRVVSTAISDKRAISLQAQSCAAFRIVFHNGKPYISGIIYDFSMKKFESIDHKDISNVENSANKIFVNFSKREFESDHDGFVYYAFVHSHVLKQDIVVGFFIDPITSYRYNIVGVKVSNEVLASPTQKMLEEFNKNYKHVVKGLRIDYL